MHEKINTLAVSRLSQFNSQNLIARTRFHHELAEIYYSEIMNKISYVVWLDRFCNYKNSSNMH